MSSTATTTTSIYELHDIGEASHVHGGKDVAIVNMQTAAAASGIVVPPITVEHNLLNTNTEPQPSVPVNTIKTARANFIIFHLSLFNFLCSMTTGLVVVGLPRIAKDLNLPPRLYLWPTSVFGLTIGSCLLLAGAIADVVGSRIVDLTGCAMAASFTLACALSQSGIQLVLFRAFQGVGMALHYPTSMSLIAMYIPSGKRRNMGFALTGMAMPLGYSLGLVVGGILVDTIGWRVGFYIIGGVMVVQTVVAARIVPVEARREGVMRRLRTDVDWIGACVACGALAMFSYVLAILSTDSRNIRQPESIALLVVSVGLMAFFPFWMHHQPKHGRPALVPNSLWQNRAFTTTCVLTVICWACGNSIELFSSLYFQEVQRIPALGASLRLLPSLIVGALLQLTTGYMIDRAPVFWLVLISTILTAGCPLIMALMNPSWPYWYGAFPAQLLAPISGDVCFTIGLIVVSEVFPENTQALAGAVYNTMGFFGWSFGLNVMQLISMLVTEGTTYRDKGEPMALLRGYQASFWAIFAATVGCCGLVIYGLRNIGKVGLKRD